MKEHQFSVWVGGVEVNDYPLNQSQASALAQEYKSQGYDDVQIERLEA